MSRNEIITENLFSFYDTVAKESGTSRGTVGGHRFVGDREGGWPSFVLASGMLGEKDMDEIAMEMKKGTVPSFMICEAEENENLEEMAIRLGLRPVNRWKGMQLEQKKQIANNEGDDRWNITKIEDEESLKDWIELVNKEVLTSRHIDSTMFNPLLENAGIRIYGLWMEDELISTTLVYEADLVAGIYFVATQKSQRGKGYGSAILSEVISREISAGVSTFVLHATSLGKSIYERLGFLEVNEYDIYWMLGKS